MRLRSLLWCLRRLGSDRRGGFSVMMAVMGTVLLGSAALGAEASRWYLAHRQLQTAADEAAIAAAFELAKGSTAATITADATDLASRNGVTSSSTTSISVNTPPQSGSLKGSNSAVEVVIAQKQPLILAGVLMQRTPTITARAVASAQGRAKACFLALSTGGLTMSGSAAVSANNCMVASNTPGAQSIALSGSPSITAYSVSTVGACSGCNLSWIRLTLNQPYAEYQLPASNPYAKLDSKTFTTSCISLPTGTTIAPTGMSNAYCSNLSMSGSKAYSFTPGTYIFKNASLSISGAATLNCSTCTNGAGVTIIFTGNPTTIGGISQSGSANINLVAPKNATDPDFNSVLFYRDSRATTNSTSNPSIAFSGGTSSYLGGAMYFPNTLVRFSGSTAFHFSACTALVAGSIDMSGAAAVTIDTTACDNGGAAVPQTQVVRIAE